MDVLPPSIGILTADGERALDTRRLQRVRVNWLEATWDKVIVDNVDLLTDCLREADVIDESSTLRVLGTQVDNIDIVLAEVDSDERQALRRLVLVEDKLLRNSEAKRQVLAQIMDYAQTVQNDWPTSNLVEKLGIGGPGIADSRRWVEENEPELKRTMRRGDYLLVIAGDGIDEGMEKLARRFADRDDPLSLSELALVSMPLYQQGDRYLLIPHAVSAVQRSHREMTIAITVQDVRGNEVPASVTRIEPKQTGAASRMPVRDEVVVFLRQLLKLVDGALPGVVAPKQPRKSIDFLQTAPDGSGIDCKIHFGGFQREIWSPILVGLTITSPDPQRRDVWAQVFESRLSELPKGTTIVPSGQRSLDVLKSVEWETSADLNDALAESLSQDFRQFAGVVREEITALGGVERQVSL